jgi:predicted phage terminase large subunit-like protein
LLLRKSVRRSLLEWSIKAGYQPATHHRRLITELEALEGDQIALLELRAEPFDTLLVMMPPGAAKSTYVNMLYPSWLMSRSPDRSVLTASHASELAEKWGRRTRNLVHQFGQVLGVQLAADSQAAHRWATTKGGEYYAVGVGVGIAGFRADHGIIDDPFGSREDAESDTIRDRIWDWYTDDFTARLTPHARQVIMHTRWHDDDLAGRKQRQMELLGRSVRVLKLPAEAQPGDPIGRAPGVMLWDEPGGYDYGGMLRLRKQDSDARTWSSLYQQDPVPPEGDFFRAEWLIPVEHMPPANSLRIYGGSDYAVTSNGGDYTVHVLLGIDPNGAPWLVDLWRHQASSDVWVDALADLVIKWRPRQWAEEQGQIKSGVGPYRDRVMRERQAWVVFDAFPTRGDKAVRAQSIRGYVAQHGLRIPAAAPWRNDVLRELLRFPFGEHDDIVDALGLVGQLLDRVLRGAVPLPKPAAPPRIGYSASSTGRPRGARDVNTI